MKILLFVPSASVIGDQPSEWFQQILDRAIEYSSLQRNDQFVFLVSGKWNNAKDEIQFTEAEIGKRYIQSQLPQAQVLIEESALETGGNFAFSAPYVKEINPDKIIIFNSAAKALRTEYLAGKIFGCKYPLEFISVHDTFSENPRAVAKEPKALSMFKKLFDSMKDGDDAVAREILLYKTPFYNWDLIDNEQFFNDNWPGGFADFKEKRLSINKE